ncbi:hypothetical protein HYPSUDRAFT_65234 [Hypholoma sublateritium FD-334 SS-4]|uniref:Aminoglycoside phosphotransferase domain-containing protein n=1 Tax=Hypholoma sublateritium (strain FD-334 SS-4) TaxID=945553 RepID=A0A0D2MLZ2_HYPSF|nr:hypothetical protein HYPSUDRAFT_65234 [Hypholoma sublateritium FD-334 SS-4]
MAAISDNWPDTQASLEIMEPEYADRVTSMVEQIKPHHSRIESYASSLHPSHLPCRLLGENYTWGQSFLVYELLFEDGTSWIIRFGMRPMDAYFNTAAQLQRKILNEVAALHLVRQRTTIPVPEIIAYHAHPSPLNPLGPSFPAFVLMTSIRGITIEDCGIAIHELSSGCGPDSPGDALDSCAGDENKREILQRYLRDIADIHVQLSRITFDRIGSFAIDDSGEVSIGPGADFGLGPFTSAKDYFAIQAEAYEQLAIAAGDEDESDTANRAQLKRRFVAALWRKAMMPLVDERDDRGPFPMRHGDLHSENILVDTTGHIVGVLDWDCAGTVPWEAFAVPTFEVSGQFSEADSDAASESSEDSLMTPPPLAHTRPVVHRAFNRELAAAELQGGVAGGKPASGRSLAALHDSHAGHVGAYLAYWMYSLACDYDQTGRALHRILGSDADIDQDFQDFAREVTALDAREVAQN